MSDWEQYHQISFEVHGHDGMEIEDEVCRVAALYFPAPRRFEWQIDVDLNGQYEDGTPRWRAFATVRDMGPD